MFETLASNGYVIYTIGFLAFIVMAASFQLNVRQHILYTQVLGMALLGAHLWLLGAFTGAALMVVMMCRNLIFAQKHRYPWAKSDVVFYTFLSAVTLAGLATWTGWASLSALAGAWLATYGFWINEPRRIRIVVLLSALAWGPYGVYTESYPMLLLQAFIICSIVIAMYRYDRPEKLRA